MSNDGDPAFQIEGKLGETTTLSDDAAATLALAVSYACEMWMNDCLASIREINPELFDTLVAQAGALAQERTAESEEKCQQLRDIEAAHHKAKFAAQMSEAGRVRACRIRTALEHVKK